CSVVGGFWMVTVGHYYFHNAVVYGSPVYPHQINVGPLHLPGTADLSYSSILYNLHDARLWRYFFLPEHGLSPAGVFFPLIFLALAAEAGRRFVILTGRAPDTSWPLFVLSGLALALLSLTLRPRVIALAPVAMVAICMAFGIYLVERRRPAWLKAAQPLYLP